MSSCAVVIGVDDYPEQALTSAVADALAFRDTLLELDLVATRDVTLLTSPVVDGASRADRDGIGDALKAVYDRGSALERLYVYFAGHGLAAWLDAAHGILHTALVPVDANLDARARNLLDFDDVRDRLRLAGPREQLFFLDACRDLAFRDRPANLPRIEWQQSARPSAAPNKQAVLYAVSLGGRARGIKEGMGVMTGHLVDALHGRGQALVWTEDENGDSRYVVTPQSMAEHVAARVETVLSGTRNWKHHYELPTLDGDLAAPIRTVDEPPRCTLTLTFVPESAAADTDVEVLHAGFALPEPRWPPSRHGEAIVMEPRRYRLRVRPAQGVATVEPQPVDVREVDRATVHVSDYQPQVPLPDEAGPSEAVVALGGLRGAAEEATVVRASAGPDAAGTVIELTSLAPPYASWERVASLAEEVPPGSYRIRFRLGPEIFSETEFDIGPGQSVMLLPVKAASPLLLEAIPENAHDNVYFVSESIGPMQTGALKTTLPIIAIKPFDATGELFGRFAGLIEPRDPGEFGDAPLRVVVALDGKDWPAAISDVRASVTCTAGGEDVALVPLEDGDKGWGRVLHGTVAAPGPEFRVELRSPLAGHFKLAAASLPGRVTAIGLTLHADGEWDVTQHLLRQPGRDYPEPVPYHQYGRMLRDLALGQQLFQGGELVERGFDRLYDMLHTKWTDPVLGCMAYYAWVDAERGRAPEGAPVPPAVALATAQNLAHYFAPLPDARVIAVLAGLPGASADELLDSCEVPVLARSCRELVALAAAHGRKHFWAAGWAGRIPPDSPWTLIWEPEEDA